MSKRALLLIFFSLVVAVLASAVLVSRNKSAGILNVTNLSDERIEELTVRVSGQTFVLHDLAPRVKRTISFRINSDSHYDVLVAFSSGRKIKASLGYVTNGMNFSEDLVVLRDRVEMREKGVRDN